jgi:ubiquinone/menaquinone biosynthesis C-methylase UbiE
MTSDGGVDLFTDAAYLIQRQYNDASNLDARLALHERFSTSTVPWPRWLFDRIGLRGGERVLDVGCGTGNLWRKNLDRLPPIDVALSDLSPGMVEDARGPLPDVSFCLTDAQSLPLRAEMFDVVTANFMLYHVPDRERAIAEMRRVLRPRGRLVTATNGRAHLLELDALMERFLGRARGHDDAEKFGLETGVEQLRRHFSRVDVLRFEDALQVTETEAIVRYILSIEDDVPDEALDALREHVDREIEVRGSFDISKDAGVLMAFA